MAVDLSRGGKVSKCRLCGQKAIRIFDKIVLGRHRVDYFCCKSCGSQQTSKPTWLDEAYSIPGLHIDVGAPTRTLKNWLAAATFLDEVGVPLSTKGIDFGAGPGLFVRLMRSIGRNFYANDKYMVPTFANYFCTNNIPKARPYVITAFEIFEHLPEPRKTLTSLFRTEAPIVLFTTWLVDDQAEDWIYYLPECGQHVFFYSHKGLSNLAMEHGYEMLVSQYFYVLYKPHLLVVDQIRAIQNFSQNSISLVKERVPHYIESVIMGNNYIDLDFALAMAKFETGLAATEQLRSKQFGRPKAT
jgi:Methyltransferase domain